MREKLQTNFELFNNITSNKIPYLLGLLWADGNLHKHKVKIYFSYEDYKTIKHIFDFCGTWSIWLNKKDIENNCNQRIEVSTTNRDLRRLLLELKYKEKSLISADKVISYIPEQFRNAFLLGFLDGDGCIYTGRSQYVAFAGSKEQNWTWLKNILTDLGIKDSYVFYPEATLGDGSQIRLRKQIDIIKFLTFIYNGNASLGFPRKEKKFLELQTQLKSKIDNFKGFSFDRQKKVFRTSLPKKYGPSLSHKEEAEIRKIVWDKIKYSDHKIWKFAEILNYFPCANPS